MYWYVYFEVDYDYPEDNDVIDVQGPYETDDLPYDNEFVYCVLADSYDEAVQTAKEDYEMMRLSEPDSLYFPSAEEEGY